MTTSPPPTYYHYWGKADETTYHLLPFHCLDVTAVARCWWDASSSLRRQFMQTLQLNEAQAKAWVLFFVALHDYGKFDVRFQRKAPLAHTQVQPNFDKELINLSGWLIKKYAHGEAGLSLFYADFQAVFDWDEDDETWEQWQAHLAAVMGHHGAVPSGLNYSKPNADISIINADKQARLDWVYALERLFLTPAGLSLHSSPPPFSPLLTGFCSVCDWLGSKAEDGYFSYQTKPEDLAAYFAKQLPIAEKLMAESGLISATKPYSSVQALLDNTNQPRGVQTVVDDLPLKIGLTLIEAPTGSGKTEAALAFAWRLLDAQLADSIVFALPTQATSNAMLKRLESVATVLFGSANIVLAHGKARFNHDFWQLQHIAQRQTAQENEEANAQCAAFLASSRKRVFLGQIGVCTVDQVLVSVLPIRHNFVRGFGLGKSVLIVDEVHAYDCYMIGLLDEVIARQKQSGGSVILLSATLPVSQKQALLKAWGTSTLSTEQAAYPLMTHSDLDHHNSSFVLDNAEQPKDSRVFVEVLPKADVLPDADVIARMLLAAEQGAQVVFICNLVDVAQALAQQLREANRVEVILFHARYRFCDRQNKEQHVLQLFGKDGKRENGRILIATQVVEQSLDLDFDWMLTQLCPVDLLFQRLGRLHRHHRARPQGFEQARCTVLIPETDDYGLHKVIYGNSRVLWRTAELLKQCGGEIVFPQAYRDWIDKVYDYDDWENEPEQVSADYDEFHTLEKAKFKAAKTLTAQDITEFADTDSNVSALTRDGEMNLAVLPVLETIQGLQLLSGELLAKTEDWFKDELRNQNIVSVPKGWRGFLPKEEDGLIYLPMQKQEDDWQAEFDKARFVYSVELGLRLDKK